MLNIKIKWSFIFFLELQFIYLLLIMITFFRIQFVKESVADMNLEKTDSIRAFLLLFLKVDWLFCFVFIMRDLTFTLNVARI